MRTSLTLLFLAAVSCASFAADDRPVVRIGMSAPLNGEMAHFGESIAAWKKYTMQKIEGRHTQLRYEVFVEDDQMQSKQAVLAAKRLVELNKVNVLLSYSSPSGAAIAPYANQKKIPHIGVAYNAGAVAGDYNVSMVPPVEDYLVAFQKLLEKKKIKNLAVFYVRNATWQPVYDRLHTLARQGKFNITYNQVYNPSERDFRLGIQQMPLDQVDAVVVLAWSPEVNILASRLHEQGIAKQLLSVGGCFVMSERSAAFDGAIDVFWGGMTDVDKLNRQLTGHAVYTPYGGSVNDGITITVGIYEHYWALNKKLIPPAEFMREVKKLTGYPSVFGFITCLPSKYFSFESHFYRIQDGSFQELKLNEL